jgi:hypothetical protein
MSGKGNAPWIVGSLLAAILIAAFHFWYKMPLVAAALGASNGVLDPWQTIKGAIRNRVVQQSRCQ